MVPSASDPWRPVEARTLYVTDLDGTLLSPSGSLTEYARTTLNHLMERRGLLLSFATARPLSAAQQLLAGCRLTAPVAVYNGAHVMDLRTGAALTSRLMESDTVGRLLEVLAAHALAPLVYHWDGRDRVSWVAAAPSPGIAAYVAARAGDRRLDPVEDAALLPCSGVFYVVVIDRDHRRLATVAEVLRTELRGRCHINVQPDTYQPGFAWLEVTAFSATKAVAAEEIRRRTGADRLVVFGDNHNDLSMFEVADEAYAVGNAGGRVLGLATGVIGSNAEDGVVRWLSERLEQEGDVGGGG